MTSITSYMTCAFRWGSEDQVNKKGALSLGEQKIVEPVLVTAHLGRNPVIRWLNLFLTVIICASCQEEKDGSPSVRTEPAVVADSSAEASARTPPDDRRIVRALRNPVPDPAGRAVLDSATLAQLSDEKIQRIGDGIGHPREASFLDGGRLVVVLDRYEPFLRLFTADGDSLWHGGTEGGGPREFLSPQVVFTEGDSVLVFQAGRISRWVLNHDTLAFDEEVPLPLNLFPLGAVAGCDGEIILYARDDAQLLGRDPRIEYLHALKKPFGSTPPEVMWAEERNPDALPIRAHSARLLDRDSNQIVILHRWNFQTAGEILELDCHGNLLRRHSELSLATGDTLDVLEPRSRALEWTTGIVAIPDGFVTAQHRYYSRRFFAISSARYRTELFLFLGGRYRGSMLIPRQWLLMDMDPQAGILLTSLDPKPHFVRIPLEMITNAVGLEGDP